MNAANKNERFEMRLNNEMIERIDVWRNSQTDYPSRAEAARRLIEASLDSQNSNKKITLSNADRLIISMLCDLSNKVSSESSLSNENDTKLISSALYNGHLWALELDFHGLFHNHEDDPRNVTEVVDILDMWSYIESSYNQLSNEDKKFIEAECPFFGKHVSFAGFCGNSETEHMSIARCFIDDLNRFPSFKNRELNSHAPSLDGYRRMLSIFLPARQRLMGATLTVRFIIELINARVHPDNRKKV